MLLGTRHLRPNKQSRTDLIGSDFVSVKSDGLLTSCFFIFLIKLFNNQNAHNPKLAELRTTDPKNSSQVKALRCSGEVKRTYWIQLSFRMPR